MPLVRAKVKIEGTAVLWWHHFSTDAIPVTEGERRERKGGKGNDPSEWQRTVLMTEDRQLYLEPSYIFGCLRDGGAFTRVGRGTLQRTVISTLQVMDEKVLVDRRVPAKPTADTSLPVYLDVRGVRNPQTKARNVRYRIAASPGWSASFEIAWEPTILSEQAMEGA